MTMKTLVLDFVPSICLRSMNGLMALLVWAAVQPPSSATELRPFLSKHCIECHDESTKEGGLDLNELELAETSPEAIANWIRLFDRVSNGEMPPREMERPDAAEQSAFLSSLTATLTAAEQKYLAAQGNARLRRMNRVEYENTLRDLLGLPYLEVQAFLPQDGMRHGYDKIAGALDISQVQMSRYLGAAEYALEKWRLKSAPQPESTRSRVPVSQISGVVALSNVMQAIPVKDGKTADGWNYKVVGEGPNAYLAATFEGDCDAVILLSNMNAAGASLDHYRAPVAGSYRFRVSAAGVHWNKGQISSPGKAHSHALQAMVGPRTAAYLDVKKDLFTELELVTWLERGESLSLHPISIRGWGPNNWPSGRGPLDYEGAGVALEWCEIEGPLPDLQRANAATSFAPLSNGPLSKEDSLEITSRMSAFATRAFRRPVRSDEVAPYVAITEKLLKQNISTDAACLAGYQAILCSPDFLFIGLEGSDETLADPKLSSRALASRLAYFLWNSPPDETLLDLAARGELSKPAVRRAQAERMLRDPRFDRFVSHFLDQWLSLRKIDFTTPDKDFYPDFDSWLRDSMLTESHEFFRKLISEDLGVRNIIDSDFLTINSRLARLYEIPEVEGASFRVVPTGGSPRGGFLTQASILKITANGAETSPVLRGAWVSEHLLGRQPLPPPPDVPAIESDASDAKTVREILAIHAADAACAACHAQFDPFGFALEQFDPIGAWRTHYRSTPKQRGAPVDASGTLADGRAFKDVTELRELLLADESLLAQNLANQFLIYATGSNVRFTDRLAINAIVDKAQPSQYGLRSLILGVIESELFESK